MKAIQVPIFGLLTDFGFDYAVASMKGVIARTFPAAQIIDIDHSLKKFSIISAAFIIQKSQLYFPRNMIFICVVDPGVGSEREMLCIKDENQWFLGPNNGIFHYLLEKQNVEVYCINPQTFGTTSRTFHGRDLFTPAAVKIAQHQSDFLQPIGKQKLITIDRLDSQTIVTYIDSFGNIKTNIPVLVEPAINEFIAINVDGRLYNIRWHHTFAEVPHREVLCYKGSNDTLELALNNESAERYFNVTIGTPINIIGRIL